MFWATLAGMLAVAGGLILWSRWRQAKREASYPTSWIHTGTPAAEADLAMEVIMARCPGSVRQGGYIEWTEELPFTCGTVPAAGCAPDLRTPRLKVSRIEPVEKSALAHEVGHYYWRALYNRAGESWPNGTFTLDPDFKAWLDETNRQIARRLGRA